MRYLNLGGDSQATFPIRLLQSRRNSRSIGSIRNIEFKLQWLQYFRQGGVALTSIRPAIPNSLYRPAGLSSRPRDDSFHDHSYENTAFRIASSDRIGNRYFEFGPR